MLRRWGGEAEGRTLGWKETPEPCSSPGTWPCARRAAAAPRASRLPVRSAPFLLHNEEGRAALAEAGFLYDSSIPDNVPSKISPSLEQRSWPYRMDHGIPQTCDTGAGG